MSIKVEKTDNKNELKLEFTVVAEKFEDAMKKVYFQTAKYFNIPGFRKGKAPMKIVEKYYGESIFYEDAFNEILKEEYDKELYKLKETMIFKGGTALKKCYFGDYRFSQDLDFSDFNSEVFGNIFID